jgi:predicted HicB family RNase H-like nuclease
MRVRLDLSPADHEALRIAAAQANVPMSKLVRRIVKKALADPVARRDRFF